MRRLPVQGQGECLFAIAGLQHGVPGVFKKKLQFERLGGAVFCQQDNGRRALR
ncbi:hypothetical protein JCM14635_01650 [Megalodesulfovibrio paquesii]